MCTRSFFVAMAFLVATRVTPAFAQWDPPPPEPSRLRLRLGPLTINPTIALTNIGFDSNVFNTPATLDPKGDFTLTVTPAANFRAPMFRTLVTARIAEDLVWYQTYDTERAANNDSRIGWRIPFNRVMFNVNARHTTVRDRPGFEIDARLQRTESAYDGMMEVRVMPKTLVGITAHRQRTDYGNDSIVGNTDYRLELNRVTSGAGVFLRYKLTPITSVSLVADRTEDRFEFSSLRDSNSTVTSAVIAFDPLGILSGRATIGYTVFSTLTSDVPRYLGPTGTVNVAYRLLGNMQIAVGATRNVEYSFEINEPYYLQTGFSASVTRTVVGPLDAMVRGAVYNLAYRDRQGVVIAVLNRVDTVYNYGIGAGYHFGKGVRLGFNVDEARRLSVTPSRQYAGLRFGSSVTYGF